MSTVNVTSEIGRLRRVMVHEPGLEVDHMAPEVMEELLFDDILYGDATRVEHRCFRDVLQRLGVETLEARTLLEEAFAQEGALEWVFSGLAPHISSETEEALSRASTEELAAMLVEGVRYRKSEPSLDSDRLFDIPPLPNWCFQRDPQMRSTWRPRSSASTRVSRWCLASSTRSCPRPCGPHTWAWSGRTSRGATS
jgi:arginine deiminase